MTARENERLALLTRRQILASGVAIAGTIPFLSITPAAAAPEPAKLRLTAGTRTLSVNGKPARVFGLVGPNGKSGITLSPGERFRVDLVNRTGTSTILHWHGQLPPWRQDGFPWPQTPPIPADGRQSYDYAPIPGTFWIHSHQGLQEQSLMTAPLIVHSAEDMRADRQEVMLMLHDFSFRTPDELLAGLTKSNGSQSAMPNTGIGDNMTMGAASMGAMNMGSGNMGAMNMGSGMAMDLNDIDYDAFLANDRTLADPDVIRTEPDGRVRLRLINAASATQFWIDLGALTGTVVAADGQPVRPVRGARLPLAIAQRLDVLIDLPGKGAYPIFAQVEGKRARTGIVLAASGASVSRLAEEAAENAPPVDLSLERRLEAVSPLAPRASDVTHRVVLAGSMAPYTWSMNGEYWPDVTPLMIAAGQRVSIEMVNHTMMAHPMHLHGHAFQVTALNGVPLAGALRDTVLVPPMSSVTIAFDADNPGRWAFHCHNLYHMMTGMMTEVRYPSII